MNSSKSLVSLVEELDEVQIKCQNVRIILSDNLFRHICVCQHVMTKQFCHLLFLNRYEKGKKENCSSCYCVLINNINNFFTQWSRLSHLPNRNGYEKLCVQFPFTGMKMHMVTCHKKCNSSIIKLLYGL